MAKPPPGAKWRSIPRHQVEPQLADLIDAAAADMMHHIPALGVIVTEGPRTHERQRELKRVGASKTLHSKHIPDLSPTKRALAVDVAITLHGKVRWDWPLYEVFAGFMKHRAKATGVKLTWGGDWVSIKDGPHFQIEV